MDVTPLIRADQKVIQSYKAGTFRISSQSYDGALAVFPEDVQLWDAGSKIKEPDDVKHLTVEDMKIVLDHASELDLVLLGCGSKTVFVSPDLRKEMRANGINIECMDTGAACRTYNVLMAEGRRLAALLIPV